MVFKQALHLTWMGHPVFFSFSMCLQVISQESTNCFLYQTEDPSPLEKSQCGGQTVTETHDFIKGSKRGFLRHADEVWG